MNSKRKLTSKDHIFDGFCHRNFNPSIDGWRNVVPSVSDYPSVQNARDTLDLFDELCTAKRRIWELEKEVSYLQSIVYGKDDE